MTDQPITTRPTQPTQKEVPFQPDQLFFSVTDERGIIRSGNEVFVSISGYPREKLIGAPHNLVRHPDMPKTVFKLFWDTIQSGQSIVAYVKNMAANGDHYWVLATVFPIPGGYLSIRIKPGTTLFEAARDLYTEIRDAEKSGENLEETQRKLLARLKDLGYSTYSSFMTEALMRELNHLYQLPRKQADSGMLVQVSQMSAASRESFRRLSASLEQFRGANRQLQEKVEKLSLDFDGFQLIAVNMMVSAARMGTDGATLAVVTQDFQKLVQNIQNLMKEFTDFARELREGLEQISLKMAAVSVQSDMVDFFAHESATTNDANLRENAKTFTWLADRSIQEVEGKLHDYQSKLKSFTQVNQEIQKIAKGLEIISQIGSIESSRSDLLRSSFGNYIKQMHQFNEILRNSVSEIRLATQAMGSSLDAVQKESQDSGATVRKMFGIAFSLTSNDSSGGHHGAGAPSFQKWIEAHSAWKGRLQSFIDGTSQETLDPDQVCKDNVCPLGQWIHKSGTQYSGEELFGQLKDSHAGFHMAAANVVRSKLEGRTEEASKMINSGGEFSRLSVQTVSLIMKLSQKLRGR